MTTQNLNKLRAIQADLQVIEASETKNGDLNSRVTLLHIAIDVSRLIQREIEMNPNALNLAQFHSVEANQLERIEPK
jgi:hypothetical protein